MRQVPWITVVIAALVFLNPIGQDFVYSAFLSNEQLSRSIAQPFVFGAIVVLIVLGTVEWWFRRRRRHVAEK